jgi:probable HAF family extracellular repeat protein
MQKISPLIRNVTPAVIALLTIAGPASESACTAEPGLPRYRVVALSPLNGYVNSIGQGVNNAGVVAGASYWPGSGVTTLWANGTATEMPFGPSGANGINEAGHLVGNLGMGCCDAHGYFYDGTTLHNIHTPTLAALGTTSMPEAINNHDEVVGWVKTDGGSRQLAYYWHDGVTVMLGTLGGRESRAHDINDLRQVVGYSEGTNLNSRAYLWSDANGNDVSDPGEMMQLSDMGLSSAANAINDLGIAAGFVLNSSFKRQPVVWNNANAFTPLALVPGADEGEPYAINNQGDVVGFTSGHGATLWRDGQAFNLNTLIPASSGMRLIHAWDINEHGWITGDGFFASEPIGFLLIPVPEPNSLGVLALILFPCWRTRKGRAGSSS